MLSTLRKAGVYGLWILLLAMLLLLLGYGLLPWMARNWVPGRVISPGLELGTVHMNHPGATQTDIVSLSLDQDGHHIELTGLHLYYDWQSLRRARLRKLTIDHLVVTAGADQTAKADVPVSRRAALTAALAILNPAFLYRQRQLLPCDEVTVNNFTIVLPERQVNLKGQAHLSHDRLQARFQTVQPGFSSEVLISLPDSTKADVTVTLSGTGASINSLHLHARLQQHPQESSFEGRFQAAWQGALPQPWQGYRLSGHIGGRVSYRPGTLALELEPATRLRLETPPVPPIEWLGGQLTNAVWITAREIVKVQLSSSKLDVRGVVNISAAAEALNVALSINHLSSQLGEELDPLDLSVSVAAPTGVTLQQLKGEGPRWSVDELGMKVTSDLTLYWSAAERAISVSSGRLSLAAATLNYAGTPVYPRPLSIVLKSVRWRNSQLDADVEVINEDQSLALPINLHVVLQPLAARLDAKKVVELSQPLIASYLKHWQNLYDLDSGQLSLNARIRFGAPSGLELAASIGLHDTRLHYSDISVVGLNLTLPLIFQSDRLSVPATFFEFERLGLGFDLTHCAGQVQLTGRKLMLDYLHGELFGGQFKVSPAVLQLPHAATAFTLSLSGLQLQSMLQFAGGDVIGTGLIDGELPVTLAGAQIGVRQGRVWARPPGGLLQYTAAESALKFAQQSGFDFALQALEDFHYQTLQTGVELNAQGDLALSVQLLGKNPAVQAGRQIRYNLNINQNLLKLLESVRMAEGVSSGLEKKLIH